MSEWIEWKGGRQPVDDDVMVEIECKNGHVDRGLAVNYLWPLLDLVFDGFDIVRYRVVEEEAPDLVNAPPHYRSHPSGIECIQVTEHMNFNLGNVVKYLWRSDEKGAPIQDLRKARWYLDREIQKREREAERTTDRGT
jgi:hypothetical protein